MRRVMRPDMLLTGGLVPKTGKKVAFGRIWQDTWQDFVKKPRRNRRDFWKHAWKMKNIRKYIEMN